MLREYVWLNDMPLALITGPAPAPQYGFIHTGQLDEPLMVTDMAQARQWDVVNDPWGNALPLATPTIAQDLRLPGQYHHIESGLFHNWHRDYDPTLGRYIEADPIGLDGGSNLFAYANDNPVNAIDPEGLESVSLVLDQLPELRKQGQHDAEALRALGDFWKNYRDMRDNNWKGQDKYFHCKANCEAAKRGRGGFEFACYFSNLREIWDQNVKGYPRSDSLSDQAANRHGRDNSHNGSCEQVCRRFRPWGLPKEF